MRSIQERQAELDRWIDELYRVTEGIVNVLYESRLGEPVGSGSRDLKFDSSLAFTIGMLHGLRARKQADGRNDTDS